MKKLSALLLTASYFLFASSVSASGGETVCTPVYGMANSCAEHVVVDTGLNSGTLFNASAISYVLGLAAFVKAKKN